MSAKNSADPAGSGALSFGQRVFSGVLLAFVLATGLTFVGGKIGMLPSKITNPSRAGTFTPSSSEKMAVFYLSGNHPCAGCEGMRQMAAEAVMENFPRELQQKSVQFQSGNYEAAGNEFFRDACQVSSPTVLLVEYGQGKPVRWKKLDGVWEHALSSQSTKQYLGKEMRAFLAAGAGAEVPRAAGLAPALNLGPLPQAGWWLAIISAFGMGILAAISPCAMAANAVALSFLSTSGAGSRRVLGRGAAYAAGRMLAYVGLGTLLVSGLLSTSLVRSFPGEYMEALLGPGLILISLLLFGLVRVNWPAFLPPESLQNWAERGGMGAALLLGGVLALAFCPMSAALFFGGLVPLALQSRSSVALPATFGLATGLPVVMFALVLSLASQAAGRWFKNLRQIEKILRLGMAILCGGTGIYYSLFYVFQYWQPN